MKNDQPKLTYESALQELQHIVAQLQEEAIGMDDLAQKVKRAAELIQFCREKMRQVEQETEGLF